jgi:hypothetical protein
MSAEPAVSILFDEALELHSHPKVGGSRTRILWSTSSAPATNHDPVGDAALKSRLAPGGTNVRVTTLEAGVEVGLHRSSTVDYVIITQGEAFLLTPKHNSDGNEVLEETLCRTGDVVVQRSTMHGWRAGHDGVRWIAVVIDALPARVGATELLSVGL